MKGPEVRNREKCNYSFFTNSKKYSVQNVTLDGNLKLVHGSGVPQEWDDNNQNEKLTFAIRTTQYCHRMGFQLSVPRSQSDVDTIFRLGKSESGFLRYYIMLGIGLNLHKTLLYRYYGAICKYWPYQAFKIHG